MSDADYNKRIQEKVSAAERAIAILKREVAEIADEGGVTAYWGEYGENGQTYYPAGTNVNDHYMGWRGSEYADENGILQQGVWISSSELC